MWINVLIVVSVLYIVLKLEAMKQEDGIKTEIHIMDQELDVKLKGFLFPQARGL